MSQNDMVIANQTAALARADINSALQALASNSLGTSAPSTTYAGQWWYDSSAAILKLRNSADSAWIDVGIFSSGSFVPYPGLASQAEAEAGTNNTKFMTPLRSRQGSMPNSSIATNGYAELANGLYLQWGRATAVQAGSITFPTAFPTAVFSITLTGVRNTAPNTGIGLNSSYSRTGFSYDIFSDEGQLQYSEIHWQAYGN
jgi:hypothetical protein